MKQIDKTRFPEIWRRVDFFSEGFDFKNKKGY